jgi:hypothetical protein
MVSIRSVTVELGLAGTGEENADVPFVGSVVIAAIRPVVKLKLGPGSKIAVTVACPVESVVTLAVLTRLKPAPLAGTMASAPCHVESPIMALGPTWLKGLPAAATV